MRKEGYSIMTCRAIRCPFESICRNADGYTDRSHGCDTHNYIISEAKVLRPRQITPVATGSVISEAGMTKIQMLKQLRQETGVDLGTAKDALDYSGWDMIGAKRYIRYGW